MEQIKQQVKIRNWKVEKVFDGYALIGQIFDHPRQTDFKAEYQVTSPLVSINFANGRAETNNTFYTLED